MLFFFLLFKQEVVVFRVREAGRYLPPPFWDFVAIYFQAVGGEFIPLPFFRNFSSETIP